MNELKKITDLLFVKFYNEGNTKEKSQDIVITILKEYEDLLKAKKFNEVSKELKLIWL